MFPTTLAFCALSFFVGDLDYYKLKYVRFSYLLDVGFMPLDGKVPSLCANISTCLFTRRRPVTPISPQLPFTALALLSPVAPPLRSLTCCAFCSFCDTYQYFCLAGCCLEPSGTLSSVTLENLCELSEI
jgi:hypothetical protein